jgi:hypothetical protein
VGHELPRLEPQGIEGRAEDRAAGREVRIGLVDAALFSRTRRLLRLAEATLARLQAAVERATLHGRFAEAQELTLLRMRLVRDHAGAWLLANRPLLSRQGIA